MKTFSRRSCQKRSFMIFFCGRKFVGKSCTNRVLFRQVWENSGKNPSQPQKCACSYSYALCGVFFGSIAARRSVEEARMFKELKGSLNYQGNDCNSEDPWLQCDNLSKDFACQLSPRNNHMIYRNANTITCVF